MDPEVQILTHRVTSVETTLRDTIGEIRDGIREIATNTGKLAVLEERHAETRDGLERSFDEIQKLQDYQRGLEARTHLIEVEIPGLRETRGWVVKAIIGVITLVGVAIVGLVLIK